MKKLFLLVPVAALVMTACTSESTESVGAAQQPQEISFTPLAQPATRAEVEGDAFPSGQDMYVASYDATKNADFFGQTTFDEDGSTGKWKASPKKYWPLDDATINFLAYTGVPSGSYFHASPGYAQSLTITLEDNSSNQYDLMYAIGRQSRNRGVAASDVTMNFKHALALIKFTVCSAADYGSTLKLQSIVLTGARYSGTYTIDNSANYNSTSSTFSTTTGLWSSVSAQTNVSRTPETAAGWDAAGNATVTKTVRQVGAGILVVPDENDATDDYTSFTINYTLDGNPYTYTYTPADLDVHQAKKYTFAITMTLNEIIIAPTVTDYVEENNNAVAVQ